MPLDSSILTYVGAALRVVPAEGWGWSTGTVPQAFEIQVLRFFEHRSEIQGGVGSVTSLRHRFHGQYVIFSPRHVGIYNFTDKLDWGYNLIICKNDPVGHERCWPQPDVIALGVSAVGYGEVTAPWINASLGQTNRPSGWC